MTSNTDHRRNYNPQETEQTQTNELSSFFDRCTQFKTESLGSTVYRYTLPLEYTIRGDDVYSLFPNINNSPQTRSNSTHILNIQSTRSFEKKDSKTSYYLDIHMQRYYKTLESHIFESKPYEIEEAIKNLNGIYRTVEEMFSKNVWFDINFGDLCVLEEGFKISIIPKHPFTLLASKDPSINHILNKAKEKYVERRKINYKTLGWVSLLVLMDKGVFLQTITDYESASNSQKSPLLEKGIKTIPQISLESMKMLHDMIHEYPHDDPSIIYRLLLKKELSAYDIICSGQLGESGSQRRQRENRGELNKDVEVLNYEGKGNTERLTPNVDFQRKKPPKYIITNPITNNNHIEMKSQEDQEAFRTKEKEETKKMNRSLNNGLMILEEKRGTDPELLLHYSYVMNFIVSLYKKDMSECLKLIQSTSSNDDRFKILFYILHIYHNILCLSEEKFLKMSKDSRSKNEFYGLFYELQKEKDYMKYKLDTLQSRYNIVTGIDANYSLERRRDRYFIWVLQILKKNEVELFQNDQVVYNRIIMCLVKLYVCTHYEIELPKGIDQSQWDDFNRNALDNKHCRIIYRKMWVYYLDLEKGDKSTIQAVSSKINNLEVNKSSQIYPEVHARVLNRSKVPNKIGSDINRSPYDSRRDKSVSAHGDRDYLRLRNPNEGKRVASDLNKTSDQLGRTGVSKKYNIVIPPTNPRNVDFRSRPKSFLG